MNITADQAREICSGSQIIESIANGILRSFATAIEEAVRLGSVSVMVSVPTSFNVSNMSNKTAQTIIYHKLITECEEKGFTVKLVISEGNVRYRIGWETTEHDTDEMCKEIAQRIFKLE
jgi:hypothetical protein